MSAGASEPESASGPKVFITYRREETAIHAGRLYDAMAARFGEANVFMDVDMKPGVDFVERITEAVAACQVLIVVMGPRWATVEDEDGRARLADPEDFVRLEVEAALRRADVTPIPVLVAGAKMPNRQDLPEEVRAITRRNALELSDLRWRQDVGRLMGTLDELLVETRPVTGPPSAERGVDTGKKTVPVDAAPPREATPPSTVPTTTPSEVKPAALWTRIGRRTRWALLGVIGIAAIVVAIVVAVGGGGSSTPALSKSQFLAQGNAICANGTAALIHAWKAKFGNDVKFGSSSVGPSQLQQFVDQTAVPNSQSQIAAIRALSPPTGDENEVKTILDTAEQDVKRLKNDPSLLRNSAAFASNNLATAYGLDQCG
jgi:hypothetical protein